MTFEEAFREHVVPDLRRMCAAAGVRLAFDLDADFYAEASMVEKEARRRGMGWLSRTRQEAWEDWIGTTILREMREHDKASVEFALAIDLFRADPDPLEVAWRRYFPDIQLWTVEGARRLWWKVFNAFPDLKGRGFLQPEGDVPPREVS